MSWPAVKSTVITVESVRNPDVTEVSMTSPSSPDFRLSVIRWQSHCNDDVIGTRM